MKIILAAIGKIKPGPELSLYEQYVKRLPWKITLKEFDIKKPLTSDARKLQEAQWLLSVCEGADHIIALDEQGKDLSSPALAAHLRKCQDQDRHTIACIIGGADGLHEMIRKRADLILSFGRVTWPHMLMRGLLAEQLYRAHSIMSGHPYHRS